MTCINDKDMAERCKVRDANKVVWSVKANANFNNEICVLLRNGIQNGKINFLISEQDADSSLNSYSGDADEWKLPVIAMEDTTINKNDRICQFRINKIQPEIEFEEVEHLDEVSRGGIGSTGKA